MKLEDVTLEIRPRSDWEAVDAGLAMARRDFWRSWTAWWMAVWPVLLFIYPVRDQPGWWVVIFFWWKLTGCRMVVFQLSRKLFGVNPRWSALWRESMRAWTRRFWYRMLLARFSPWKLMAMVVEDLEGLRGSKYRTRMAMVTRRGEGMCMFLTLASASAVVWLGACLLVFGILFLPRGMEEPWTEVLEMQDFFLQAKYHWLVVGALVVHEPDEVMLMTNTGQSVRIPVGQIREAGRNTQGVKLISLREGELLQDIARVISDGDAVVEGEVEGDVDADAGAEVEPGDAADGEAPVAGDDAAE